MTLIDSAWAAGPDRPSVHEHEVHIWRIDLTGAMADAEDVLNASERHRATSFLRPADALQYALTRAAVRRILGRYLGVEPRAVSFVVERGGKPRLRAPGTGTPAYNVTHSGRLALLAVGTVEVGVDIEHVRPAPIAAGVAAGIVSASGPIWPDEPPSAELDWAFFRTWTRTEAVLKATGEGLSAIDRRSRAWIRGVSTPGATTVDGRPIAVHDIPVGLEYAAALAILGPAGVDHVACWAWRPAASADLEVR